MHTYIHTYQFVDARQLDIHTGHYRARLLTGIWYIRELKSLRRVRRGDTKLKA